MHPRCFTFTFLFRLAPHALFVICIILDLDLTTVMDVCTMFFSPHILYEFCRCFFEAGVRRRTVLSCTFKFRWRRGGDHGRYTIPVAILVSVEAALNYRYSELGNARVGLAASFVEERQLPRRSEEKPVPPKNAKRSR